MLAYMWLKCAIEIVPCVLIDEDMCHLNCKQIVNYDGDKIELRG